MPHLLPACCRHGVPVKWWVLAMLTPQPVACRHASNMETNAASRALRVAPVPLREEAQRI